MFVKRYYKETVKLFIVEGQPMEGKGFNYEKS